MKGKRGKVNEARSEKQGRGITRHMREVRKRGRERKSEID